MRRDALAIFHAALAAADPYTSTLRSLKQLKLPLNTFDRIFLVAVGKAATGMAAAIEKTTGARLTEGIALTKYQHSKHALQRTKIYEAGHPVPDAAGFEASGRIEQLLRSLNARDLLITAISGGASALLFAPIAGLSLEDKQQCTDQLLRAGADIFELNAVRKHLARLKGGRMAALAYPATVVSLLLSDVIGDPIDVIGSGPTSPDTSTVDDARGVLAKYHLPRYLAYIYEETPKPSDPIFRNVRNVITASNHQALTAAAAKAKALGYRPLILSSSIQGEAREVGRVLAAILRDAPPNCCILSGGETTVTVKGKGKGGRNQELALSLSLDITGIPSIAALCAGTDGTDGPTDAAGAFVTGDTITDRTKALTYLADNNSYEFFRPTGALLKTGPTGTNVMDINILIHRS
jgi:glycerate 2-kinase